MTTFLFYNNYDKLNFLYAIGSHVSKLECLYDCLLDKMFLFNRNELIHITRIVWLCRLYIACALLV